MNSIPKMSSQVVLSFFSSRSAPFQWLTSSHSKLTTLHLPRWTLLKSFCPILTPELQLANKARRSWTSSTGTKKKRNSNRLHPLMSQTSLRNCRWLLTTSTSSRLLLKLWSLRTQCSSSRTPRFPSIRLQSLKLWSQRSNLLTRCPRTSWLPTTTSQSWWAALPFSKFPLRFYQLRPFPSKFNSLSRKQLNFRNQSQKSTWASRTWSNCFWRSSLRQILKPETYILSKLV